MCPAGALRGSPASITSTERRARDSASAPLSPAAPPPTTTTSYLSSIAFSFVRRPRGDTVRPIPQIWQVHLLLWQYGGVNDDVPDLDGVLDAVGPRLKALRQQRGATLAQLSESTGISVSTLSRLESGQRKPTLELMLLLARAHQLPLDELVDAPATGDPRVHLRPLERNGTTIIPLTRRPGGIQAFK